MLQVLAALFGISAIVIVHEAGHLFAARWFGIRVTHFSLGFGPVLAKYRPRGSATTFQLCAIPFLASVTVAGMNPTEPVAPNDPTLFPNKSLLARTLTIAGGPIANYLLAMLLVFALAVAGSRQASVGEAARLSVTVPAALTIENLAGIAKLVANRTTEGLVGPVGMGKLIAEQAERGLSDFVGISIMISVALGLFNLLPLPFLDGGRLIFLAYEAISRRKPNARFEALVHAAGMVALLALIAFVTLRDVVG